MIANDIAQILMEQFGGNRWTKHGKDRVYFDAPQIAYRYGLDVGRYGTGNISSATLNGERISNSEARRILDAFTGIKVFFDLVSGRMNVQCYDYRDGIQYPASRQMFERFQAEIMEAINGS